MMLHSYLRVVKNSQLAVRIEIGIIILKQETGDLTNSHIDAPYGVPQLCGYHCQREKCRHLEGCKGRLPKYMHKYPEQSQLDHGS
jgi:hypothetical protein